MLSDDQFAGIVKGVNEPDSGFSVKAFGSRTGQKPTDAYMVGLLGHGQSVKAPTDTDTAKRYVESQRGPLSQPDKAWGGWNEKGRIDFDVSQEFPRTKRGEVNARRATVAQGQKAYGEVDVAGEYVTSHYAPTNKRRGGQPVPHHTQANKSWVYGPIKSRRPR